MVHRLKTYKHSSFGFCVFGIICQEGIQLCYIKTTNPSLKYGKITKKSRLTVAFQPLDSYLRLFWKHILKIH